MEKLGASSHHIERGWLFFRLATGLGCAFSLLILGRLLLGGNYPSSWVGVIDAITIAGMAGVMLSLAGLAVTNFVQGLFGLESAATADNR